MKTSDLIRADMNREVCQHGAPVSQHCGRCTIDPKSLAGILLREHDNAARLIAAAPDLLAVLRDVADYWAGGDVPAELDARMRAAIAAATGEV